MNSVRVSHARYPALSNEGLARVTGVVLAIITAHDSDIESLDFDACGTPVARRLVCVRVFVAGQKWVTFAAHCRSGRTGHALVAGVVGALPTAHDSGIESLDLDVFGAEVTPTMGRVGVAVVCCKLVARAAADWSRSRFCLGCSFNDQCHRVSFFLDG